jgi:hypothetical protein
MNENQLIECFQDAIEYSDREAKVIRRVLKTPNETLKICCTSEKEAEELRNQDWTKTFEGAEVLKDLYGIIIHGVAKNDIDPEKHTPEDMKTRLEEANHSNIKIIKMIPLRRKARNPKAPTHSIVIFMESPTEANDCISYGIKIGYRHYPTEKYVPCCQIRQCFKCQGYGHKAKDCTRTTRCGKCAQEHDTRACTNETKECALCKDAHYAFDYEKCSVGKRRIELMETVRYSMSTHHVS